MAKQIQTKKKVFCKQNIPNMLVILRMVLAIAVVTLILLDGYCCPGNKIIYTIKDIFLKDSKGINKDYCDITLYMLLAGILFVLASITDWLDGKLARKYNWVSDFGKFWDPIADKVLVNSTLIAFAWCDLIPVVIPIIMIARDVLVDADRMIAAKQNIVVAANIYGKMKTVLQMIAIIFIFFLFSRHDFTTHALMYWLVQNLLMYVATLMSVFSGVIYFKQISKAKKEKANARKN